MQKSKKIADQSTTEKDAKAPVRHRVVQARMPRELRPVCHWLSRHVRDLRNTCIYLGRTAVDCLAWDAEGKKPVLKSPPGLPKNGQAVLEAFNAAILAQNSKRKGKDRAKAKLLPLLDSKGEKPFAVIMDATLFEGCVRSWPDELDPLGRCAYGRLPSWPANHAVQKAKGEFSAWLAQLRDFRRLCSRYVWIKQALRGPFDGLKIFQNNVTNQALTSLLKRPPIRNANRALSTAWIAPRSGASRHAGIFSQGGAPRFRHEPCPFPLQSPFAKASHRAGLASWRGQGAGCARDSVRVTYGLSK